MSAYDPLQPYARPQQPPAGQGQLIVNFRKPFGLLASSITSPRLTIDGYPAPARWEQNAYPVTAGRHVVRGATSYLWEYGAAEQPVDIYPGQSIEVHYSGPMITFAAGRMGFEQQPRPGLVAFWVIMAIPILILVITFAAIAIGVASS